MNPVSIVQGRLTISHNGKLQCFPKNNWQREFDIARQCDFDAIELLFEEHNDSENPLLSDRGVDALNRTMDASRIKVSSILVDYSMAFTIWTVGKYYQEALVNFENLTRRAKLLNVDKIVLPLFELDELDWGGWLERFKRELSHCVEVAARAGVKIALETNLCAENILENLRKLGNPDVFFCYDLGNATAFGHNLENEIRLLSHKILTVHVKDRLARQGPNVKLGTGNVDFSKAFRALRGINYRGYLVCETMRGSDPVETARYHNRFIRQQLSQNAVFS